MGAILHVLLTSGEAAEGQAEGTSRRVSEPGMFQAHLDGKLP